MRGRFHRHLAATAMTLAVIGGASAQSNFLRTSQTTETPAVTEPASPAAAPAPEATPAPATETATPPEAPAAAPAAPEPQQMTGKNLLLVPLSASLQGNDILIAEELRSTLATRLSRVIDRRQDRAAVEAFYRDRGFAPLWVTDGAAAPRAKAVAAFLRNVAADGLEPADYPAPAFTGDAAKLAQDELAMTNTVLAFARHARTGRLSYSRVSSAIHYDLEYPDAANVLAHMANAGDIAEALDAYQPQQRGYKALKAKLAEARGQRKPQALIDTLIVNMERWRWMPRDLGKTHVMVNIPDYTLAVMDQNKQVWTTKIVVGKVGDQATPLLTETMKYITVNPTWNVPPSIIRNEYLPALERDPNALERIGLKMTRNKDGSIRIYQPPGEKNALGRIRFNFPNRFLVYQHDTPQKHLFAQATRAYSHGCMRVQNPEQYAEVLLSVSEGSDRLTADRIRGMYGERERTLQLKTHIPVHLTYQTAFVDEAGQLQSRADVYGHDRKMIDLMRNGRSGGDTPVARNQNTNNRPVTARLPSQPETQGRRLDGYFAERPERMVRRDAFAQPGYIAPMPYFGSPTPRRAYGAPN